MSGKSTAAVSAAKLSLNADRSGLLQRKCDCGNAAGLTGKCSGCQQKKLTLQRREKDGGNVKEVPPILHELLPIQAKLTIGKPNDIYEQEADLIADRVMRMPEPSIQRQMEPEEDEEEGMVQRKIADSITPLVQRQVLPEMEEEEEVIQTKTIDNQAAPSAPTQESSEVPHSVHEVLSSPGQSLDPVARAFMEPRFGYDFSGVRVHTDGEAATAARAVQARAFTVGRDIVFGAWQYAPTTSQGQRLLAHELSHVIQQGSGQPTPDIQRDPNDLPSGFALDCGSSTLKCPPKSVLINVTSNMTLGARVHNIVLENYLTGHQRDLGDENFILIDRGFGEVHTKTESSRSISRLAVLDPPVHGAFAKGAKKGERGTGTLERRPDILDDERDTVSEIKSCTLEGRQEGRNDLVDYFSRLALAPEKVPPSGYRRKRNWSTSSWRPADFVYTQGTPTFQLVFSMPERGLILYSIWVCQPQEQRKHDKPKDKEPGPSESLPEQLVKLGGELAKALAAAGLLDIAFAIAGVIGSFVSSPLVALAVVVLGIAFFWEKLKRLGNKVARVAQFVWDKIAGLAEWVRGKYTWILGKLYELGIKLYELGSWLAGKIVWLADKLAEGLEWIAGKIAAGGRWVGRKIATAAEAIWDWLWSSDVEQSVPNVETPVKEPAQHCVEVSHEDAIVKIGPDLLFPFNKWELKKEADDPLEEAAAKIGPMLQKDDQIMIKGYTDNIGSEKYNQYLSKQRAMAVKLWFVEHRVVPMSRIQIEGYGKTRAQYNDPKGRKKDRRVEIWVPKHGRSVKQCW